MKTAALKFICFSFLVLGFCVVQAQEAQSTDSARIVFMRPYAYVGTANLFKVKLADGSIIKLVSNSYYALNVVAGTFEFATVRSKTMGTLEVEAGRTYYVRAYFDKGFWVLTPELKLADSIWGRNLVREGKLKDMKKPLLRPLNRVGVILNAGPGFNDIAVIKTTNNLESSMGFAGGNGVSVQVGREVEKYLDIALSYSYMNRGLTPYIKNGTIDFSRHFVSLTPSFIIPIQGGYAQRIKIGGGVDFYFSNTLKNKTTGIPGGINDTWNYGQAVGYHAQLMYEVNLSEHFSMLWGISYYNVEYSFESGGLYKPVVDELSNPKGDGLSLKLGVNYHFW